MKIQEGIYYRANPPIGKAFCLLSLRAEEPSQASDLGVVILEISKRLVRLKKGMTTDIKVNEKHRKIGNLTILYAYGPRLFEINGSKKKRPSTFSDSWNFKSPDNNGGGKILDSSDIKYSAKVSHNHLLLDHVVFQFIADSEFYTNRAVIDVWKELYSHQKVTGHSPFRITGLYKGFQREDQRNWLGFHDGVSNLKPNERPQVILINSRSLGPDDRWTINGSYLAFMRIGVNLGKWEAVPLNSQEIIIGRDKQTGCPLVGVGKNGKPLKDSRCPVPGTSEVIDPGNERFRDHPPYSRYDARILKQSHIGGTTPIDEVPIWNKKSIRIYRQGFEFLVPSEHAPGFVAGLNFVSFQNTPERLYRALTYQQMILQKYTMQGLKPNLDEFMSVWAAGIFFVPPIAQDEPFPGARIFFSSSELRNMSNRQLYELQKF